MAERVHVGSTTVTGNLADDPKLITTKNGQQMVALRVLENRRRFNRESGEWEDREPVAYEVTVGNDRLARGVSASLRQGDRVTVSGSHSVSPYQTSSGELGVNQQIWAKDVSASMFNQQFSEPDHQPDVGTETGVDREASTTSVADSGEPDPSKRLKNNTPFHEFPSPWARLEAEKKAKIDSTQGPDPAVLWGSAEKAEAIRQAQEQAWQRAGLDPSVPPPPGPQMG